MNVGWRIDLPGVHAVMAQGCANENALRLSMGEAGSALEVAMTEVDPRVATALSAYRDRCAEVIELIGQRAAVVDSTRMIVGVYVAADAEMAEVNSEGQAIADRFSARMAW